nr:HemK2/MTQ2 family protein methyltransferase [Motilibacter aurantiacus]
MLRLPGTYRAQGDTQLLAETLRRRDLAAGRRVLDVGTGGGALALAAARAGASDVTAVDLSLRSVLTARLNSRVNRTPITVRQGDLFAPVRGERFGLVLANPPYVPAASEQLPRHRRGRCWDAGRDGRAVLDRICAGVPDVLAEDGVLLLTHSVLADEQLTLDRLAAAGLTAAVVERALEPFGPVMRQRAAMLEARGLLEPGQESEELVVIEARRAAPAVLEVDLRRRVEDETADGRIGAERAA